MLEYYKSPAASRAAGSLAVARMLAPQSLSCIWSAAQKTKKLAEQRTVWEGGTWKGSRGYKRRTVAADVREEEYENADEWKGAETSSNKDTRIVEKEQKRTTWTMDQRRE